MCLLSDTFVYRHCNLCAYDVDVSTYVFYLQLFSLTHNASQLIVHYINVSTIFTTS